MNNFELVVSDDVPATFLEKVNEFANASLGSSQALFLTGGSQAKLCYPALGKAFEGPQSSLANIDLYLGDERVVPLDSGFSNTALIDGLLGAQFKNLTNKNIHSPTRVAGFDLEGLMALGKSLPKHLAPSAHAQLRELTAGFSRSLAASPSSRLVHLGLGPDGHVASIFPKYTDFGIHTGDAATTLDLSGLNPFLRLSVSMEFINSSELVILGATGSDKGEVLRKVLLDPDRYPAGRIQAAKFVILVDRDAAAKL